MPITDRLLSLSEHEDLHFELLFFEVQGRYLILRGFELLGLKFQVRLGLLAPLLHISL